MLTNLEVIQQWYASPTPELLDPEVEWLISSCFPAGGNYYGRNAIFEDFFPNLISHFDQWTAKPDQLLDAGDAIVALGHYMGRVKNNGAEVSIPFAHVWWIREGKIVKVQQYADTALLQRALMQSSSK